MNEEEEDIIYEEDTPDQSEEEEQYFPSSQKHIKRREIKDNNIKLLTIKEFKREMAIHKFILDFLTLFDSNVSAGKWKYRFNDIINSPDYTYIIEKIVKTLEYYKFDVEYVKRKHKKDEKLIIIDNGRLYRAVITYYRYFHSLVYYMLEIINEKISNSNIENDDYIYINENISNILYNKSDKLKNKFLRRITNIFESYGFQVKINEIDDNSILKFLIIWPNIYHLRGKTMIIKNINK